MTRVFVYGSLLAGEANHFMMQGARFVGAACTRPLYTLLDLGPYPALRREGTTAVKGELYDVGPELLARLDAFEGHPDLYCRAAILLEEGGEADAWLVPEGRWMLRPVLASGDWRRREEDRGRRQR